VNSVKYQEPQRFDHEQTRHILANGSVGERCELIVSKALNDDEPIASAILAALCNDTDWEVRAACAVAVGHLARRFRHLDERWFAFLESAQKDDRVAQYALDALEDVEVFLRRK